MAYGATLLDGPRNEARGKVKRGLRVGPRALPPAKSRTGSRLRRKGWEERERGILEAEGKKEQSPV